MAETWEFNSAYQSFLEYDRVKDDVVDRTTPIYTLLAHQPALFHHAAQHGPVQPGCPGRRGAAPLSPARRAVQNSLQLVREPAAETAEEFAYYELLRKNTEAVGTVNDPLPVQLTGNVRRTDANPTEPVLGYVGAHTVQQKRIFITRAELPFVDFYQYDTPYKTCDLYMLVSGIVNDPNVVPISRSSDPPGIFASSRACVDCRLRAAT